MSKHDRCILIFIYISLPNVSLLKKSGRTGGRDCERGRNPKFVISPIVLRDSCAVYFYLFVFFFIFIKYYSEIHLVLRGLSLWRYH